MRHRRRSLSATELSYYRNHFLEAIREDGIICLECGSLRKALGSHLFFMHEIPLAEYKAKWGYNRQTGFVSESTREKLRRHCIGLNLGVHGSRQALEKARQTRDPITMSKRLQGRLTQSEKLKAKYAAGWQPLRHIKVDDETLRAVAKEGRTNREIATSTGLSIDQVLRRLRRLGLHPPVQLRNQTTTEEIVKLRDAGLWPSEIATRTGLSCHAILKRLWRLRRKGEQVQVPKRPRPISRRRVTDQEFLGLIEDGLRPAEIAVRVGIKRTSVITRAHLLRRQGALPGWTWKQQRKSV